MAHPQNSPRGLIGKKRIDVDELFFTDYSTGTAAITISTTGNLLLVGGLALSGESTDIITQDSTAVKLSAGIVLSGQGSANAITQNSTGVTIPDGMYLSGQSTNVMTQNSTGTLFAGQIRVGGSNYIGGNTTGYLYTSEAALPSTDGGNYKWAYIVNSTGVGGIAVNTTGTTWKYARMTSTINTT